MADISKFVDKDYERMGFDELADCPVEAIRGLSKGKADALKKALNVETIRDLAGNEFVRVAQAVVALAGPRSTGRADQDADTTPRDPHTPEEVARRGRELYEREIRRKVEDEHAGCFLVLDVTTGEYEIDENSMVANDRALAKNPNAAAVLYGLRIGEPAAYRIGSPRSGTAGRGRWR